MAEAWIAFFRHFLDAMNVIPKTTCNIMTEKCLKLQKSVLILIQSLIYWVMNDMMELKSVNGCKNLS